MKSIRMSRPPSSKRKWNQLSQFGRTSFQGNTYIQKRLLSWPHFSDEPRVQEKQQVKGQHTVSHIHFCSLSGNSKQQLYGANIQQYSSHTWVYSRFIEIKSNLRRKKLRCQNFIEQIKAPIFLEAVLAVLCTFVPPQGQGQGYGKAFSCIFSHDESSITIGGYESAIAPYYQHAIDSNIRKLINVQQEKCRTNNGALRNSQLWALTSCHRTLYHNYYNF